MLRRRARALDGERAVTLLLLAVWSPALVMGLALIIRTNIAWELAVTAGLGAALLVVASIRTGRRIVSSPLSSVARLLEAARSGDQSIKAPIHRPSTQVAEALGQAGAISATLAHQRAAAVESDHLLSGLMDELESGVFAFGPARDLVFANSAGRGMLGLGRTTRIAGTTPMLFPDPLLAEGRRDIIEASFGGRFGRYEIRRSSFTRGGVAHRLVVVTDLSLALQEEERLAWRRLIRVLSHEINNTLSPIKSVSHSLMTMLDQSDHGWSDTDVRKGLALIHDRSAALARFIASYAALAKLPAPTFTDVDVGQLIRRAVALERRRMVRIDNGPALVIAADSVQLEQLLINLVRNAVDATSPSGDVVVSWTAQSEWVEVSVTDDGIGLPEGANLFVPFFSTKRDGSGIGLALSRQIAEAHGGTLTLSTRTGRDGAVACLRLPCRGRSSPTSIGHVHVHREGARTRSSREGPIP